MTKTLSLLLSLCLMMACAAKKNSSQGNSSKLNLDEIEIGKNQTGLIGTIVNIDSEGTDLKITLNVVSSKQGGANSPALSKGSTSEIIATAIFLRQYQDKNKADLATALKKDMTVLALISGNMIKQQNNLVHISF